MSLTEAWEIPMLLAAGLEGEAIGGHWTGGIWKKLGNEEHSVCVAGRVS